MSDLFGSIFYTGRPAGGTSRCGYLAEKILNKPADGGVDAPKDAGPDIPADAGVDSTPKDIGAEVKHDTGRDGASDAKVDTILDGPKPDIKIDTIPPDTLPPDTTPPVCTVGTLTSLTETDFKVIPSVSTLTNLDYYSLMGSLMLKRNWTEEWVADSGSLPTWTLFAPSGANGTGTAVLGTDSASGNVPIVDMNSLSCTGCTASPTGSNQDLYYTISPSFTSAGGVVQVTWRLVTEEPSGTVDGCEAAVEFASGSYIYRPGLTPGSPGSIKDASISSVNIAQDTKSKLFTLRVEFKNTTVRYYTNEQMALATTNTWTTTNNYIRVGDNCPNPNNDGQSFIRAIAYYNSSDHVPFAPTTGNFTGIYDFGSAVNTFKNITFNGSTPSLTNLQFATRTGNTAVPDFSWSSEQAVTGTGKTLTIQSPAARYIQVKATLNTSDNLVTPTLDDFTVSACK